MIKKFIAVLLCLVGLAVAVGYNDWQQGAAEGLQLGFKMGQAYTNALNGINVTGFNDQVDVYNAWVRKNFGEDPNLLMSKMDAPVDLSKPYLKVNDSNNGGIVHSIDGNTASNRNYTTNDINLLSDSTIAAYRAQEEAKKKAGYAPTGDGYLGGV
jgi:hypothetical protein